MKSWRQWRGALAILGAVSGVAYASGREQVLFFAQLGPAAWLGIPLAAAAFGLLVGLMGRAAVRCHASGAFGLCRRLPLRRAGTPAAVLYGLLLALASALMLCCAGQAGALALPVRHGFAWGAALSLALAALLALGSPRALEWIAAAVFVLGVAFYAGLAADARPARIFLRGEVELALEGSVPAAMLLALAHGALCACLAAGPVVRLCAVGVRPEGLGARCAGLMCLVLACANAALLRGGRPMLAQALPTVLLAARWGLTGFWLSVGFGFFSATATLAAALTACRGLRNA